MTPVLAPKSERREERVTDVKASGGEGTVHVTCGKGSAEGIEGSEQDRPRPLVAVMFEDGVGDLKEALGRALPLADVFPLPFPCFTSRSARAPKLSLRANGDVAAVLGGLLELDVSSSSNGLSLKEPEVADETLSPRLRMVLNGEGWLGEPDRPRVVSDRRRRLAWAAAVVIGP